MRVAPSSTCSKVNKGQKIRKLRLGPAKAWEGSTAASTIYDSGLRLKRSEGTSVVAKLAKELAVNCNI